MTREAFGCLAVLLATGLALGQSPAPTLPTPEAVVDPETAPPGPADETGLVEEVPAEPMPTPCGSAPRFWLRTDYLFWWVKQGQAPPLVTTGSPTDPLPGALGQPGTTVLFGGALDSEEHSGMRLTAGWWLGDTHTFGLEAGYFFLGTRAANFGTSSTDAPGAAVLARPFFDVLAGREDASLSAFPGLASGTVTVAAPTYLQGGEVNFLWAFRQEDCLRLDLLAGFRYLELYEALDVGESVQVDAGAPVFPGSAIAVADHFGTLNNFYGGQVGVRARRRAGAWDLEAAVKVALGDSHEVVSINGSTVITPPGQPAQAFPGGLLALPSNSGRFGNNAFAVVPEAEVNLGFRVTRWLRAYLGYTFLYWSDVVRPGDQVERDLNRQQIPTSRVFGPVTGPALPAFTRTKTDFWAQGLTFGLEFRY
jgi:hypothetical protein